MAAKAARYSQGTRVLPFTQNRKDDIIKAANNKEFQEQLFREFHL